jgi:anti-sigma regulatory factor (Ser/Thr protein kinase)
VNAEYRSLEKFRHEALLYSGQAGLVDGLLPFLREGIAAEEPILVVESRQKIDLLRSALEGEAEYVMFADMSEVGANPARIIPAWQQFVERFGARGKRLRGVGEPIWKGRPADELAESQRHEALLNVAFGHGQPWWLLCPYDTSQMEDSVIEEALRSHEFVMENGTSRSSDAYVGIAASGAPFEASMADPGQTVRELVFGVETLLNLRGEVSRFALVNDVTAHRAALFVTAINEIATNTILHGGGAGTVRMWRQGDKVVAEIRDAGRFDRPLADRNVPGPQTVDPRGLWLANQLCDLVQIRRVQDGTAFRLHMKVDPARPSTLADS